uniref:Uncharacterized protein n=1 Tax=Arundo donax TaxID=35708 RepID=A0A0A9HMK2_ARUDO
MTVLLGILIICVSSIYTCLSYENTVISIEIFDAEEGVYARVATFTWIIRYPNHPSFKSIEI